MPGNDIGSLLQLGAMSGNPQAAQAYMKYMAVQRQQALAQSLLTEAPPDDSANKTQYAGLANAGNKILGAVLAKRGDAAMANLYAPPPEQPSGVTPLSQQSVPEPQLSNQPGTGPNMPPSQPGPQIASIDPAPVSGMPTGSPNQALGQALQGNAPAPPQQMPPSQPAPMPPSQAPQQPAQQGGFAGIMSNLYPPVPGRTPAQSFWEAQQAPEQYYKEGAMTPEYRNALSAAGGDPNGARQILLGAANKNASVEVRPEGYVIGPDGKITYGPNESSNVYYTTGPNNEPIAHSIQGGAEAAASAAGARKAAEEANTVLPEVTLADGRKVPMYAGAAVQAAGGGQAPGLQAPLGIRSNNPGNLQPGGQESQFGNKTAGIIAASNNLDRYAANGVNTLGGIISQWAPPKDAQGKPINDTQGYISDVSKRLGGIDPTRPLNLKDPNVKGAVLEAMFQHENANQYTPPNSQGGQPQIGITPAQEVVQQDKGQIAAGYAKAKAVTDSTLKAIDGLIALNDKTPDSVGISPEHKAEINGRIPGLFPGDSGALAQWNQLNGIGVLGGLKQLQGLGRLDLPEVNQVVKTNGIPSDVPRAQRLGILQNLRTMVQNNLAASGNNLSNLNQPGITTATGSAPMGSYGSNSPHPQDVVDELRRRGVVK